MTEAVGYVLLFCLYYNFKFQSIFCMTKMHFNEMTFNVKHYVYMCNRVIQISEEGKEAKIATQN